MIPRSAELVVGDDDHHVLPLRAGLELRHQIRDVRISFGDGRVARMLIEVALRLVERHGGQAARGDIGDQLLIVLQVRGALGAPSRRIEVRVVIEGLMMRLEIGAPARRLGRIDDAAFCAGRLAAVGERRVPGAGIPRPGDMFLVQPVADGGRRLRRQGGVLGGVRVEPGGIARRGRIAARLIRRLHGIHRMELAVAEVVGRRDVAALRELRRSIQRRGGRTRGKP